MKRFFRSFGYAFRGIGPGLRGQVNIFVMLAAAAGAIALGVYYGISALEWALIVAMIGLVLSLELLNTAGEKLVDILSPEKDDRYGQVKDILAAAVLIASVTAAIVGGVIFVPRILGG